MGENSLTEAHPLFFDSLFPSFQSTTPETVISDYRQRKRADSRAEHDPLEASDGAATVEMRKFTENNVEFYAEVIGKLVGSIRDGFTTLIDDVKQRRSQQTPHQKEMKIEKLKTHHTNANSTSMSDMIQLHHTSIQANGSTTELPLVSGDNQDTVDSTISSDESDESGENDSSPWSSVVQVIARKRIN
jgi:hypothetical protein